MRPVLNKLIFFIGWLLSPLTFWNDVFVNIPLSYICANLFIRIFPADFLTTVVIFYWLGNVLGLFMMYASGKSALTWDRDGIRNLLKILAAPVAYSILLVILNRAGIIKPL